MRVVPEVINWGWVTTLSDEDLVDVESRMHARFTVIERREKKLRGPKYELMRGSAELMAAWDRWSRLANAVRERSLTARRELPASASASE